MSTRTTSASTDAPTGEVLALADIRPTMIDLVGGKALGLGRMINSGEQVPDGFCLTTASHRRGTIPRQAVRQAYRRLGGGPVAVRSSATAEDLADASFAGQQDTYLGIDGEDALLEAIEACWASLDNERARAYRDARGWQGEPPRMAVVVQRMIDPRAAGVMFTANPITGTRTETVIDAIAGLGDVVVDGSADADHYLLADGGPLQAHGCLSEDDLDLLRRTGRRLEQTFGRPQDVEWAIDHDDRLWLLQSRAITTLFPVPAGADPDDLRVYLEVGHMQGMLRPVTPMGMSVLMAAADHWFDAFSIAARTDSFMIEIAGRLYVDLTGFIRNRRSRRRMLDAMDVYGPRVKRALAKAMQDPRLAPRPGQGFDLRPLLPMMIKYVPRTLVDVLGTLARPDAARERAFRVRDQVWGADTSPRPGLTAGQRIARAIRLQEPVIIGDMMALLPPLWVTMAARAIAEALLKDIAEPGELDSIGRGMPYNVTTEMDLQLWACAEAARPYRELIMNTPAEELAERYRRGELPDFGLTDFLDSYGRRGAAEIDVGVPRWAEDPTPIFGALAGYLHLTDPQAAPDVRFRRAAEEAEQTLDRLIGRAARRRPVRAMIAGFLLRRWRSLAGLRELPKFIWVHPLYDVRQELLLAGEELAAAGRLEAVDDVMFLTLDEAAEAAAGRDLRELAISRRVDHEREARRRQVPGLLLSDGTMPELLPDDDLVAADDHDQHPDRLVGMPAAAGRATGTVRVVHDPTDARIEPGDILVAATTDPGWTPLFLTAGGLVTETGSPMAHGPTVAREYGIPAVICIRDATTRLQTGQTVTVDGASGVVIIESQTGD